MILLKNCSYLLPEGKFVDGDILLDGEKIVSTGKVQPSLNEADILDIGHKKVVPGFIDIHTHGAVGYDIMTSSPEEIEKIALYLAKCGTTTFFPTTITSEIGTIETVLKRITETSKMQYTGASIDGAHIEGPYISALHKGCHDPEWIKKPDISEYERFKKIAGSLKLHYTVAPEIEGAKEFIEYVCSMGDTVSIGHTDAVYDTACDALKYGANIFTHLFNAMRGIHHREPGTAGAALNSEAYVELICDGIHVHPGVINLIYKLKGKDRIVLVTDAMQAAGLGDGEYMFGGFKVKVMDGAARKEDGTLASSTLSLHRALKNIIAFTGIPLEYASAMASANPAKAVGIYDVTGSIEPGKRADLVVLDDELDIDTVICNGHIIKN